MRPARIQRTQPLTAQEREDVALIVQELEIPRSQALNLLRASNNNVTAALSSFVNAPLPPPPPAQPTTITPRLPPAPTLPPSPPLPPRNINLEKPAAHARDFNAFKHTLDVLTPDFPPGFIEQAERRRREREREREKEEVCTAEKKDGPRVRYGITYAREGGTLVIDTGGDQENPRAAANSGVGREEAVPASSLQPGRNTAEALRRDWQRVNTAPLTDIAEAAAAHRSRNAAPVPAHTEELNHLTSRLSSLEISALTPYSVPAPPPLPPPAPPFGIIQTTLQPTRRDAQLAACSTAAEAKKKLDDLKEQMAAREVLVVPPGGTRRVKTKRVIREWEDKLGFDVLDEEGGLVLSRVYVVKNVGDNKVEGADKERMEGRKV